MPAAETSGESIAVIGGGISGLTTALHLQEQGYHTIIYSREMVQPPGPGIPDPAFATLFPAACIIPHSVEMPDLTGVFGRSQEVFDSLSRLPGTGIRWQTHYEFGAGPDFPDPQVRVVLRDFRRIDPNQTTPPFRYLQNEISGWSASILFAEMAAYIPYLMHRYRSCGGEIRQTALDPESMDRIRCDGIVNCTGLWARRLFMDNSVYPVRGILVLLEGTPFPPRRGKPILSYNYTPPPEAYRYDVYFFPRTDGWLLGGSREVGTYRPDGTPEFPPFPVEMTDGIPEPILGLNATLLTDLTGVDLRQFRRRSFAGYRPGRTGGVRLEAASELDRPLVHNYGHGGAGVALSWGCAERVAEILADLL